MKRIEAKAGESVDQFFARSIPVNTGESHVLVFNGVEIELPDVKTPEELICYLLYRIYFSRIGCPLGTRCPAKP